MRIRPTVAEINLKNLRKNFRTLRDLLPAGVDWIPMIKADAYGHGAGECARVLREEGAAKLGVSLVEEAIDLRAGGDQGELLVFGMFEDHGSKFTELKLTPVLSTFQQIEALHPHLGTGLRAHLKLNTGMNRLGFMASEFDELKKRLRLVPQLQIEAVLTHLHSGEDADAEHSLTEHQFREFERCASEFLPDSSRWHIWSTSALLKRQGMKKRLGAQWPAAWEKLGARPGLSLYGAAPFATDVELLPVMTFKSQIAKINWLKAGETAGYGATFQAKGECVLGVVPVGYADGYHRALSNVGIVLVNGERCQVVGRVSMDFLLVELTHLFEGATAAVEVGAEVVLFGESSRGPKLDVREAGEMAQIIPWEMLTSVSKRVPREYIE